MYNLSLKTIILDTLHQAAVLGTSTWTNAAISTSTNRIGEFKRLTITISSVQNIANSTVFLNPALFLDTNAPAPVGKPITFYSVSFPPLPAIGVPVLAAFTSAGSPFPNPGKLNTVYMRPMGLVTGKYDLELIIIYHQTYDCEGYINPVTDDNHSRFLKDKKSNPLELDLSGNSVYTNPVIDLRGQVYVEQNGVPGNFGNLDINPKYGYKGGFYGYANHLAAGYHSSPEWILKNSGLIADSFSTNVDCDMEFRCESPITVPTALVVKMIRTDKVDQTVDFEANYELDTSEITGAGVTTTKFKVPYTGPINVTATRYKWTFKINKTGLVNGGKYRIIAIVTYKNIGVNETTTFISPEYAANADVPYTGGGFTNILRIGDIKTNYSGNQLSCSIEERMHSRLQLDFPANAWKNNILSRLGITTINDLRRYLVSVEFQIRDPKVIPPSFTNEFYDIYDYRKMSKSGPLSYAPKSNIQMTVGVDQMVLYAEWRNHYDLGNPPFAGVQNGTLIYPGVSLDTFANKNLEIDWILTFVYDDYITPFTDVVIFTQKMFVRDYVADTILKVDAQNPPFDAKPFWCPEDMFCLQGEIVDNVLINPADYYYLIVNIEANPGNIGSIEESEVWVPPIMPQFLTSKIYAEETAYEDSVPLKALFCIDTNELILNTDYKVTVFAKRS